MRQIILDTETTGLNAETGDRIVEIAPKVAPADAVVVDLGDLTLLPGLMDMEVNLLLGGPGASVFDAVQDDAAFRTLRGVANARRTLRAGFTTVRNLGLFVQTGGDRKSTRLNSSHRT